MKLSIIVPTRGRESLLATFASIVRAGIAPIDEVLVGADGHDSEGAAREYLHASGLITRARCRIITIIPPACDLGGTPRNECQTRAEGDYLLWMDDDDIYADGALGIVRAALAEHPDRPHMFRMRRTRGQVLWEDHRDRLTCGNVGTPMFVCPNVRAYLARWDGKRQQDFRFFVDTLAGWPDDALIWHEDVICIVRPHEGRRDHAESESDAKEIRPVHAGHVPGGREAGADSPLRVGHG